MAIASKFTIFSKFIATRLRSIAQIYMDKSQKINLTLENPQYIHKGSSKKWLWNADEGIFLCLLCRDRFAFGKADP